MRYEPGRLSGTGFLFNRFAIHGNTLSPEGGRYKLTIYDAAAVPEPASWAMMLMGFGTLGAVRRKRRFASASSGRFARSELLSMKPALSCGTTVGPILRADDGGEWELDLRWRHGNPVGQRARVQGKRSGFNLIDVEKLERV